MKHKAKDMFVFGLYSEEGYISFWYLGEAQYYHKCLEKAEDIDNIGDKFLAREV